MANRKLILRIALPAAILAVAGVLWHFSVERGSEIEFNRDIRPILNENCVTCHGGVQREAELSLLFREEALKPAKSGERAIVPGDPRGSELMRRVRHSDDDERMPLDGAPLSEHEIALLEAWIADGAAWEPHWAYVAPDLPNLPAVSEAEWPENGIDQFVLARLEDEGLVPSPRADCARLIRRVSLDLVGLPPSPREADAFCDDPLSYEHVVDSLLASPRFGERWTALWLDLARYADSNGYETDNPRVIWKYRDWLIRAFNDDMPFDQFTIEQIAGDLLPDPTEDQLVATAFHRNTMTNTEGGTDDEEFRVAAVIDRVNTTFEVWQGTTMACAQCHGHPYDPFRHEEFYRLYAFFNNTADADKFDNEPKMYHFSDEVREEGDEIVSELDRLEPEIEDSLEWETWVDSLEAYAADGSRPSTFDGRLVPPVIVRIAKKSERSPYEIAELRRFFAGPRQQALRARRGELQERLGELEPISTPIMQELSPDEQRYTHVFDRGNWLANGERVDPDVPLSLPPMPDDAPRNRLGLAQWLVAPENPLTARVTVNRFWEQLFGQGIVETVEDFGTQGASPTHLELLDWLALRFENEHAWSVKKLLKDIVMSATYQQSSRATPELLEHDPKNQMLARGPRFRLSAEQVRDQALAVGGLLSEKMYGPSVYPVQPEGLWNNPYSSLAWETSEGEDRHRRAIYTFWRRTVPYPSLLAFDAMSREMCTSRRIRTNTPLQALVTLNDPVYVEAATALAERMGDEGGSSVEGRIRHGYRRALLSDPSAETMDSLRDLYERALDEYRNDMEKGRALFNNASYAGSEEADPYVDDPAPGETAAASGEAAAPPQDVAPEDAALAVVANAIMNLDSFLTKE